MQAYYWLNYAFTGMPEEADEVSATPFLDFRDQRDTENILY